LKVGAADDPLEREADRVADAVMAAGQVGSRIQPSTVAAGAVVRRNSVTSPQAFNALDRGNKSITFAHDNTAFGADRKMLLVPKTAADVETKVLGSAPKKPGLTLTRALDRVGQYTITLTSPTNKSKSITITVHIVNSDSEAEEKAAEAEEVVGTLLVLQRDATATSPEVQVHLEAHQNKHQHHKSMIPQLGTWTKKKGTTFKAGRGLDWHRNNTAVTMRNWALGLGLTDGQSRTAVKEPMADGYIYDAKAMRAGGVLNVTYHCNPPQNE
jgi:hypothetical protein